MGQETIEPTGAENEAAPVRALEAPKIEIPNDEAAGAAGAPFKARLSPALILGVSIAVSAALGSVVGALAGVALMRPSEPQAPTVTASVPKATLSQLSADIASLKASVEASGKAAKTQAAQFAERIERVEKAAVDPAKQARLPDADKKVAAADTTGSIVPKEQQRPPIVDGWVLRDIFDGRAVIESRNGLYEVGPGSNIPGLGRIETIKRQDGRWVVVTPRGVIISSR